MSPISSQAAELLDHKLEFQRKEGIATAVPTQGQTFHGVLHLMSHDDMVKLDRVNSGWNRSAAVARLYDGTEVPCALYIVDEA